MRTFILWFVKGKGGSCRKRLKGVWGTLLNFIVGFRGDAIVSDSAMAASYETG